MNMAGMRPIRGCTAPTSIPIDFWILLYFILIVDEALWQNAENTILYIN